MPADLSHEAIERALRGRLGKPLRYFDSIGSTNTEALKWAEGGAPEGALVVANHQTEGRGRWGRTWLSAPDSLLQFSLILRPELPVERLGLVTTALGVACADVIEVMAGIPTGIKWPNDVIVRGRKLAGILVESKLNGAQLSTAIAGVGINVGWTRAEVPEEIAERATSISIESDAAPPARADLLGAILASFDSVYELVRDPERSGRVIDRATDRSEVLGRNVTVSFADGSTLEGHAVRLLDDGALELDVDGDLRALHVAEITQLR
jgi:BirA family biotin operon repressor/biotin-[acetyl-CoA-carboxylase] ligase